jgi:cobalt-zinc-cadmium efflux system membrane fusion protein
MIKTLAGLHTAARLPVACACAAIAAACVLAGCDASKASAQNEPAAQAPAPAGVVRVKPESLKMLDIAVVADPQGTQMAWAPARVAFAEDRVATVSVPLAARVVSVRAHVGDIVKAGDELATLVSPEALRVRYEVEAARSAHDVASVEVRRQQTMVERAWAWKWICAPPRPSCANRPRSWRVPRARRHCWARAAATAWCCARRAPAWWPSARPWWVRRWSPAANCS